MRTLTLTLLFALLLPLSAAAEWHGEMQRKMGTRIEVQIWHEDAEAAKRLLAEAMAEFDRIEARMSTYREDSEISQVNAQAHQRAVPVSRELFDIVQQSLALSELTDGAFDITFDSVGQLYSYRDQEKPGAAEIAAALPALDWRLVQLDAEARTIRFAREGVRINLGGIGKGYATERVAGLLRAAGIRHALVNAGGDTRLLGDRRGQPWMVGIRDPDHASGLATRLPLADEAISTSGDYERYFIGEDGQRYHHILDPGTGHPAMGLRSVSIIGPEATLTDGLSTSVFVMGLERGLELVEQLAGYEAVIVDDERRLHFSSGLSPAR
ncbi:MAG: FAD:protein FMN transferase [Chromatiales bacterium]|nr:FAD:protein FMN transferase [Chromatiales bacterium]